MIPSKGGCFELTVDGKRLHSKLESGTFPDDEKLLDLVDRVLSK
jgi:selenoprotein W-related protein